MDTQKINEVFGSTYLFQPPEEKLAPIKRVALFAESFFPRFDGVSQHVYNTLCYLQQTGREVLVFAPDDAPREVGPSKVVRLPSFGVRQYPGMRVGLPTPEISRHLARFQPDLIHLFAPTSFSFAAIQFGRKKNIPVVADYETDLPQYMAYYGASRFQGAMLRWLRFLHNRCDLTLVPSTPTLHQLERSSYRHLACWQNGVNEQRFNPSHYSPIWRKRLLNGRDPSSLLCIFVGRLASEKNIESLLEIARMPDVALTIIGDGPKRDYLETVFNGTQTYFTGSLFGDDLACAFASADVFVSPSTTETFGLVTIEAMASGLPAIICKQGGGSGIVMDGTAGFVCDSPEGFCVALRRLIDDPDLRLTMSILARQEVLKYTWNRAMTQLEGHYMQAACTASERKAIPNSTMRGA